jgi:hypothetical protein
MHHCGGLLRVRPERSLTAPLRNRSLVVVDPDDLALGRVDPDVLLADVDVGERWMSRRGATSSRTRARRQQVHAEGAVVQAADA